MSFSLRNHPFAVEAFFDSSVVLTFAVAKDELEHLVPECLSLDTFDDQWGFVAMAMVQTKDLRPKGFPKFMGHDFFLIGYRIFVRYTTAAGKRLRGLYILKSETDKQKMAVLGNIFTHYKYSTTDINVSAGESSMRIQSVQSKFDIAVEMGNDVPLPAGSPFKDWKEARRFAGPLPFTFSYDAEECNVLVVEGVRENWTPVPIHVKHYDISFIKSFGFKDIRLANAFIIKNIPYQWNAGRVEKWTAPGSLFKV